MIDGSPITSSPKNASRYLSTRYSEDDEKYLKLLGVEIMSDTAFLLELERFIRYSREEFTAKPKHWHSLLAGVLNRLFSAHKSLLRRLPIIPLKNGTWVTADSCTILFPSTGTHIDLPNGLKLELVDAQAAADPERGPLFRSLGVSDLDQGLVITAIQAAHYESITYTGCKIGRNAIVSHIKYLYDVRWQNTTSQQFWFVSESGDRMFGSELYQDSSKPNSASKFFGAHRRKFPFIHNDFLSAAGNDRELWAGWLERNMQVATMPRLVQSSTSLGQPA